jgi:hypothetical protein
VLDRHGSVSHPLHSLPSQEKQLKPIHKYTWGHTMDEIDSSQIFRVLLQNPNGIRPYEKDLEFRYSLNKCASLGIGAISMSLFLIPGSKPVWEKSGSR